jgi:hypothetical protein
MIYEVVPLNVAFLDILLKDATADLRQAYFSRGSASLCLLANGVPVFAGGIVNLKWNRGEAWILPTPFFRSHVKTCLRELRDYIPSLAKQCGFRRIQATCVQGVSAKLFMHLGFEYEGTMKHFGPNGETCSMYSRTMGEG